MITDPLFWEVVLGGTLRLAAPLLLAALGELLSERAGVLNLGIEGIMAVGALAAVVGASLGGWPAGLGLALLAGLLLGGLHAALVLVARADQIVSGIALALVATGLAAYAFALWQPSSEQAAQVPLVPTVALPWVAEVPVLGPILAGQSLLVWLALGLAPLIAWWLRGTRGGLRLRAVGDDPEGARQQGLPVTRLRAAAVIAGGGLMALGGAALTVGTLGAYSDGVVAGRGYVALAIVIVGGWTPVGVMAGALLFATVESLRLRLVAGVLPGEVLLMLPYLVTLALLLGWRRPQAAPRSLGQPMA